MLVASNGMVSIYKHILDDQESDVSYAEKKIANGLGATGILIIVVRLMDKAYYREKLLPSPIFEWADGLYQSIHSMHHQAAASSSSGGSGDGGEGEVGDRGRGPHSVERKNSASSHSSSSLVFTEVRRPGGLANLLEPLLIR